MISLNKYKTFIFDCDGVILNSNKIKTEGFFHAAKMHGKDNANRLIDYHLNNGGISRNVKFKYFYESILKKKQYSKDLKNSLKLYSYYVEKKLKVCEHAECLDNLRHKFKSKKWLIISGSNEIELKRVLSDKKLDNFFDAGIYGSPTDKKKHLKSLTKEKKIISPAIFFGDSIYDYECAKKFKIDFIFVYNWTDLKKWKDFCEKQKINYIKNLKDLL